MSELQFGRWDSFDSCVAEMTLFHSDEDAMAIAEAIRERVDSNTLFKSVDIPMKVMKSEEGDIIVYGPCSWEKRDPVGDVVTTEFMVKFFDKWFNNVPVNYRNIMLDHENFQVGEPLLTYIHSDETKYYTHVHEKAPMLLAKIRPDDGLEATKKFRQAIIDLDYKSYSISWFPVRYETILEPDKESEDDLWPTPYTCYHYDGDPIEVTICRYGMVDAAKFNLIKSKLRTGKTLFQFADILEKYSPECIQKLLVSILNKPFADYDDFADCVAQNQDKDDPEAYCAAIQDEAEDKEVSDSKTTAKHIKSTDVDTPEVLVPLGLRLELNQAFNEALKDVQREGKEKGKNRDIES